jgi:hypothetical protein
MASAAQLKLAIDSEEEYRKIQKQASKKSLWGSIGRTIGGLVATALTGGAAGPIVAGMMAAGGSFLGGAIGSNQARISGGKFYKGEREDLRDKLGPLGEANVTAALKSGITAGMGQAAKMGKDVAAAKASGGADAAAKVKASYGGLDFANSTASKAWGKATDAIDYVASGNLRGDLATRDPRFEEFKLDDWSQLKDPDSGEWLMTPKEYQHKVMGANPEKFGLDIDPTVDMPVLSDPLDLDYGQVSGREVDLWAEGYSKEDIDSIMSGEYNIISDTENIRRTGSTARSSEILDSLELIEEGPDFTVGTPDPTNWTTDELEQHIRGSRQLDYDAGRVELWEQPNTGIWQGETNYDGTKTIWQGDFSTSVAPTGPRFNPETGEVLENLTYDPTTGELVYPNIPNVGTDASTIYQNKLNNTNINQVDTLFNTNNTIDTLGWAPSATDTTNWRK